MESIFRIYKVVTGKQRKDGACLVKSYGCNGNIHVVVHDAICFDSDGKAYSGKSNVLPTRILGECTHNNECKNLGGFIEDVDKVEECPPSLLPNNGFRFAGEHMAQGHITFFPKYTPRKSKKETNHEA